MMNYCPLFFYLWTFDEDANSHALLNIKDILVFCTIRRAFLLFAVSMQIKHINVIKTLHQTLAHPSKGGIIQVAMISDESENPMACLLDTPLCKAEKLHIVILQPFRISLSQWFIIYLIIVPY